jgi:endonuclease/exonuclease/phosphatase family metal-dependent hydrolase
MLKAVELHVLSFNIHKGFAALGSESTLARIREAVRSTDAHILCLQEVAGDAAGAQQFEYLADSVWHHHAYGKNAVYESGHHGNAILSKYPIKAWENIDISTNGFERRGMLHVTLDVEGVPLHVVTVHLNLFEGGRRIQLQRLEERLESHVPDGEALILAGDFNDWRRNATGILAKMGLEECFVKTRGREAATFPVQLPALCLDRIYVRGFDVTGARVLFGGDWKQLSDHAALLATLQWP